MDLYIMRHGIATERGRQSALTDRARPLTTKGVCKVRRIARAMQGMDLSLDLVLSSPYLRARQTAKIVAEVLRLRKQLQLTEHLAVGSSPKNLIEQLAQLDPKPDHLLLVGHEPFLSNLISLLLAGKPGLQVELKKGGLCRLTVDSLLPRRPATLHWLLTPKQMTRWG